MKKIINNKGTSLLELVVALAIFSTLMLSMMAIFQSVNEGQNSTIIAQFAQESMKYTLETISKEMRFAQKANSDCEIDAGSATNKTFNLDLINNPDSSVLYFKNKNGECVEYYLKDEKLMVKRNGVEYQASPSNMIVSDLDFKVYDSLISDFRYLVQPMVVFRMKITTTASKERYRVRYNIQTSVSSRNYE